MTISKVRSILYKTARLLGDVGALASGNPKKIVKRLANKYMGRTLGRGFFR